MVFGSCTQSGCPVGSLDNFQPPEEFRQRVQTVHLISVKSLVKKTTEEEDAATLSGFWCKDGFMLTAAHVGCCVDVGWADYNAPQCQCNKGLQPTFFDGYSDILLLQPELHAKGLKPTEGIPFQGIPDLLLQPQAREWLLQEGVVTVIAYMHNSHLERDFHRLGPIQIVANGLVDKHPGECNKRLPAVRQLYVTSGQVQDIIAKEAVDGGLEHWHIMAQSPQSKGSSGGLALLSMPRWAVQSIEEGISLRKGKDGDDPTLVTWPCLFVKGGGRTSTGVPGNYNCYVGFSESMWKQVVAKQQQGQYHFDALPAKAPGPYSLKGGVHPLGQAWQEWFTEVKGAVDLQKEVQALQDGGYIKCVKSVEGTKVHFQDGKRWFECIPKCFEEFANFIVSSTNPPTKPCPEQPQPDEHLEFTKIPQDIGNDIDSE